MTSREILTLQFGHYSNFIGTHWWNIQETSFSYDPDQPSEINHDVLYREGVNFQNKTTYTPRLLLVDLKNSFGWLSEIGSLYNTASCDNNVTIWDDERIEVVTEDATPKTPFIKSLDNPSKDGNPLTFDYKAIVKTWSDYIVPRFHPRTGVALKGYEHKSTTQPFDIFTYGRNIWNTPQFSENFCDRIRNYVEECDLMQGFHVLLDSTDGFAGLGSACLQHLRDEYGKSILTFPCIDATDSEPSLKNLISAINTALCWQNVGEHSSLYSPLCCGQSGWPATGEQRKFEHLTYDLQLKYHSSAILATALDTLTLRYRRKEYPNVVLSDLCADLNKLGRKAAATSLSLPFPMNANTDLIDILDAYEGPLWTSLTPSCEIPMDKNMQSLVLRGIPEDRLKRPLQEAQKQMSMPAYRCSSVHEMMTLYLSCTCHASATYLATLKTPLSINEPYPLFFNDNLEKNGDITNSATDVDVQSVPVMAGLHSGGSIGTMYESLYNQMKRVRDIKKYHAFTNSGLEEDEFTDCLHYLLDSKEEYEDHYI